ncbi:MAG: GPP34 family phosphoprotein [Candidatus Heimdallarchaeota archaeon]|nr:GPP34 family phosphoprotein [Candidatus Heimdallarchaeota archaeon]
MYFGNLSEELLLCVLDARTGKINSRNQRLSVALVGGLLMELILHGKLAIVEDNIILVDENLTEDELLDEILIKIKTIEGDHSAYYWIRVIQQEFRRIEDLIMDRLIAKGIIRVEPKKILWIFTQNRYFIENFNVKELIRNNIVRIVIEREESDHRTLALLSLLHAIDCESEIFTPEELELSLDSIKNLIAGDLIGQSIRTSINNTAEALMRSLVLTTTY